MGKRLYFLCGLLWPLVAHADFNVLLWDNDLFSPRNADAYYSNAFIFHHVSDAVPGGQGRQWSACPGLSTLTHFAGPLLMPTDAGSKYRHSWGMGQIIETPFDLTLNPPDPNDQPYAGLLYGSCGFHVQTAERAESLELLFGVVGPWALAEEGQNLAHKISGGEYAQGWDAQLHNEAVANLMYDRQRVLAHRSLGTYEFTVFDSVGFAVGPLMTMVSAGINAAYANKPEATFTLRPNFLARYPLLSGRQPLGFYTMSNLQLTGVARNLFLDGNTWVDSASVDHKPLVISSQLVAGYGWSCLALQLGLNVSTRTFTEQQLTWPRYGTLAVIWGCAL